MAKVKDVVPTEDVVIDTAAEATPSVVPAATVTDPKVKGILDGVVARLATLEGDFLKSKPSVEKNRADLEKFRDFILEDTDLSFDQFAEKAAKSKIIEKMESPKLDLVGAMSTFMPMSSIWGLFTGKGSDHASKEKTK